MTTEADKKTKRDSELISEVGVALFGPMWKQGLAAALQVSASALYAQAKGARTVTPALRRKLLAYVREQPAALSAKLAADIALCARVEAALVAKGDVPDAKNDDRTDAGAKAA